MLAEEWKSWVNWELCEVRPDDEDVKKILERRFEHVREILRIRPDTTTLNIAQPLSNERTIADILHHIVACQPREYGVWLWSIGFRHWQTKYDALGYSWDAYREWIGPSLFQKPAEVLRDGAGVLGQSDPRDETRFMVEAMEEFRSRRVAANIVDLQRNNRWRRSAVPG